VLFERRLWSGLADGSVTVAFRRWKRPTVKRGGTLQSPSGLLAIDEVEPISLADITDGDARRSGATDRRDAIARLRPDGQLYRIRFHRLGDDPRVQLRQRADLDEREVEELRARLRQLEWAEPVLRLIADCPGVVSTELAPRVGMERAQFKQRVRRLKALGLTESLEIGYRLSPRGAAFLERAPRPATVRGARPISGSPAP
jgi:hypothetical protein